MLLGLRQLYSTMGLFWARHRWFVLMEPISYHLNDWDIVVVWVEKSIENKKNILFLNCPGNQWHNSIFVN